MNDSSNQAGIDQLIEEYQGKSDDELITELINAIAVQKRNGTFNDAEFTMMVELITPMLSNEQREKLNHILSLIG